MRITFIILIFPLLFLHSCTNSGTQVNAPIECKIIDINTNNPLQGSIADYFQLKQVIPLDTCREAFINGRSVNNVIFIKDKIILSDNTARIKVFNKENGRLYKVINRSGRGPEEYSERLRLVLQDGDYIIARAYNGDLMYYDINGNFIKKNETLKISRSFDEIENLSDGSFLHYVGLMGLYSHKDPCLPYYSAHLVSKNGERLKEMIERSVNSPKVPFISTGSIFYKYNEEIYLSPVSGENTIYKYDHKDSLLKKLYTFNIDNIDIIKQFEAAKDNKALEVFINNVYTNFISCVTKNYILFLISGGNNVRIYVLVDKNTQEIKLFDAKKEDDINKGNMARNYNGQAIKIISYNNLVDKDDKLLDTPLVREIQKVTTVNENMNAVLCIYEEK